MLAKLFLLLIFNGLLAESKKKILKDINLAEECTDDVSRLCNHIKHGSNFEILTCLQRSEKIIESISKPCHNFLWQFKNNYLNIDYFNSISNNNCHSDILKFKNCSNKINENEIICLLKHKNDITNQMCLLYVEEAVSIVFSDIFLVNKFLNHCKDDVQNLQCGRLDEKISSVNINQVNLTSQAATINCLVQSFNKVRSECRKQILRLGEIQSDDFHLDPAMFYACREDREILCTDVISGNSQVYRCLEKFKYDTKMSLNCRAELSKKQKLEGFDYKVRKLFTERCAKDIINHKCVTSSDNKDNVALSTIILCLIQADNEDSKENKLDPHCRAEILIAREQFSKNPEMSIDVQKNCDTEIKKFCSNIKGNNDGDVIHCLLRNSMPSMENKFSLNCVRSLKVHFKIVNPTEDIAKLDPVISQACANELKTKCSDINMKEPDDRYECLLQQIDMETSTDKMNEDCKTTLITLAYFVERDYSLNHKLYKNCYKDAMKLCKVDVTRAKEEQSVVPHAVLHCLVQRWNAPGHKSLLSYKCELEIKSIMKIEASNIKLNFRVYSSCFNDIMKHCKDETYKMDCLQLKYQNLQTNCKNSITEFLSLDKEEYSMKKIIARSCGPMVRLFCKNEKMDEENNFMGCLVRYKHDKNMEKNCQIAIEHFQIISLENIKINHKFARFCSNEIKTFCGSLMSSSHKLPDTHEENEDEDKSISKAPVSKSDIITCLSRKLTLGLLQKKNPFSSQCYEQFTYEYLQRSDNLNLDPELQKKCEMDITNWCSKTEPDQILTCLQSSQDSLSDTCYGVLVSRQQLGALDIQLDLGIQHHCQDMIDNFCIAEQKHKVFKCLHTNMRRDGFNKECKAKVLRRLQRRLVEIKLNPELIDNCKNEMENLCNATGLSGRISEIHQKKKIDVINCLRLNFVEHKKFLRANCRNLVFEIVMDAHANYHLDPHLYENCNSNIKRFCSKEIERDDLDTDGRVQDCLKHNLLNGRIKDKLCSHELYRLLREGKADVHVDIQLYNACSEEISRICYTERLGSGKKLSCLLWALDDKHASPFVSQGCKTVLFERKKMWEYASKMEAPENLQQMLGLIAESRSRNYFLIIFAFLMLAVLIAGLIFGRITKRVQKIQKRR